MGRGRGRGRAVQQGRVEGGEQIPAQGMEDGHERMEGGRQLPAQRMDDQHGRGEGGQHLCAQGLEDEIVRLEGEQELHAQGLEGGQNGMEEPPAHQPSGQGRELRGLVDGEEEDIADRIRPIIPPANQRQEEALILMVGRQLGGLEPCSQKHSC